MPSYGKQERRRSRFVFPVVYSFNKKFAKIIESNPAQFSFSIFRRAWMNEKFRSTFGLDLKVMIGVKVILKESYN